MDLDCQGIGAELGRANFRDPRLVKRLQRIGERLSAAPALSFPKALATSAELEAAYRFFSNPLVTPDGILSGHFEATRQRCQDTKERTVLVLHDSTTISFRPDGERRGLGRLHTSGQSFFAHVALAITDDETRRPLGIAGLHTWVRGDEKPNEHRRWGDMVETAAANLSGANLIHVMDREADDYRY